MILEVKIYFNMKLSISQENLQITESIVDKVMRVEEFLIWKIHGFNCNIKWTKLIEFDKVVILLIN